MSLRDFFPEIELQQMGFSPQAIAFFRKQANVTDTLTRLSETEASLTTQGDAIDAANTDITALNTAVNGLDTRIDAYDALAPFVRQDQTTAWSAATGTAARTALASYAGQVVSNPPTQAEMQALDDAAKAISQHVVALINDLRGNGALT